MPADAWVDLARPRLLELGTVVGVLDVVKAGELVWQSAHVAAALDVVLAPHRVAAAAIPADFAGEQGKVDQREDVIDGVVVLGDPQGPTDHAAVRLCVGVRGFTNRLLRDAGDPLSELEGVRLDIGGVRLVAGGSLAD